MVVDLRRDHECVHARRRQELRHPRRTVRGEPTAEQASARSVIARSAGDQRPSMLSTGSGSRPGTPRRRFTNACCNEVNSRAASSSVSAANTFNPAAA